MSRIYSPNESYDVKGIGVEFYHGAAVSTNAAVIANLTAKSYTIDSSTSVLSQFDKLPKEELVNIATVMGLTTTNKTKAELVSAIETFINKGILPYVTNVASSGLTNLVLTLSEALYDGAKCSCK